MINHLKAPLKAIGLHKVKYFAKKYMERQSLKGKSRKEIFTDIYKSNSWNGKESISGEGSDLTETVELLSQLPAFLEKYKIKSMIDLPCGDFNWMQYLEYELEKYTGIDIVEDIVKTNNIRFGSDTRSFVTKDCLSDDIGEADLLFCRDLLIHFSDADIIKFFTNIGRSNVKYVLTTHFIDEENSDIATGQWRPVNLVENPYGLSEPHDMIVEKTKMFNERFVDTKVMALWSIDDIRSRFTPMT